MRSGPRDTQIKDTVMSNLFIDIDKVMMYTDSRIVLGYINNSTRRFYVYVGNRVQRIRKSTEPDQWTYVNTNANPADEGTRSIPTSKMASSLWLNGLEFLQGNTAELPTSTVTQFPLVNPESEMILSK